MALQTNSIKNSRFKTAKTSVPNSDAERIKQLLDDGQLLIERFTELITSYANSGKYREITKLAIVAKEAKDPQRGYQVIRNAANVLIVASQVIGREQDAKQWEWASWHDEAIGILAPYIYDNPYEPELLNLLGISIYELGYTKDARRVFDTVRTIDPDNERAKENLRACKERLKLGNKLSHVPEKNTPLFLKYKTQIKQSVERALHLKTKTISVCMIVKDEEEMLDGCLSPIVDYVDQIVICDTGSTDKTREIAEKYGALIVDFPWNGSFSDARNEALSYCNGDWVLWLDADEHMVAEDAKLLPVLAQRVWVEGYQLIETNFTGSANLEMHTDHTPMRLFQRRPEYCWQGTVHEQLLWNFPTYLHERIQQSPIHINHYGYLSSVIESRNKNERNLSLLLEQVKDDRNPFTCFNIATEYISMDDYKTAHTWSEEALQRSRATNGWQANQYSPLMVQRAVSIRRMNNDCDAAIELAEEALEWWPEYTDLIYEQALTYLQKGEWLKAKDYALLAINKGDAPKTFVASAGKGGFRAKQILAAAYKNLGELEETKNTLEEILKEAPQQYAVIDDLITILLLEKSADIVDQYIDDLLIDRKNSPSANLIAGAAFHEHGAYEQAEKRYAKVLSMRPKHGGALASRAELRLIQRRMKDAWDDAMLIEESDMLSGSGARTAFLAAIVLDDDDLRNKALERITNNNGLLVSERSVYSAWDDLYTSSSIDRIIPTDDVAASTILANLDALVRLEAFNQFEVLIKLLKAVIPNEKAYRIAISNIYIRHHFADLAGEELMLCAERFGDDAEVFAGLGKVATMKEMWEDAEILLGESLSMNPHQPTTHSLLKSVREHRKAL